MIEGLILLSELAAVVLLLWTVQRHDTPGARPPTDLFAYRDPGQSPNKQATKVPTQGQNNA